MVSTKVVLWDPCPLGFSNSDYGDNKSNVDDSPNLSAKERPPKSEPEALNPKP